ncbi:integumentary mucin C.1-like, partial [Tachysurus fulvidraco]|uniref:integumentary mucin C.1-like n=1 Tax=Tachysurus fulvidraco TaxID=1234273 RepID=UPI001FEFA85A
STTTTTTPVPTSTTTTTTPVPTSTTTTTTPVPTSTTTTTTPVPTSTTTTTTPAPTTPPKSAQAVVRMQSITELSNENIIIYIEEFYQRIQAMVNGTIRMTVKKIEKVTP